MTDGTRSETTASRITALALASSSWPKYDAIPSMNHCGGLLASALPSLPWNRISNWKTWVSSCWMSCWSSSSGRSTGSTMRLRAGTANAPTPSGMNSAMTLVCSNSAWVA